MFWLLCHGHNTRCIFAFIHHDLLTVLQAFTGSIVELTQNLEKNLPGQTTSQVLLLVHLWENRYQLTSNFIGFKSLLQYFCPLQFSGSQPSKPMSRFKMQRK